MNKGKRYSVPVTAIIIFIILTFSACSPAQKSENTGAQADAVSSAVEPEAEKTDGETVDTLEDGTYVPTLFTVSGGTGKVKITCPEVVVTEGEAQARIEFSSSHYEWVKVNDVQYDPENADDADRDNSVFRIPVRLDEEMTISGLTTAMSEPHEIEYTLFISLTQEDKKSSADGAGEDAEGKDGAEDSSGNGAEINGENDSADGMDDGEDDGEDIPAAGKQASKSENASRPPAAQTSLLPRRRFSKIFLPPSQSCRRRSTISMWRRPHPWLCLTERAPSAR